MIKVPTSDKLPWMPFCTGDWFKDPGVQMLDAQDRGIWLHCIFLIWEGDDRGRLTLNGRPYPIAGIAAQLRVSTAVIAECLDRLVDYGIADRDESGVLSSRRMIRDDEQRRAARANGAKGGNPNLKKHQPQNQQSHDRAPTATRKSDLQSTDAQQGVRSTHAGSRTGTTTTPHGAHANAVVAPLLDRGQQDTTPSVYARMETFTDARSPIHHDRQPANLPNSKTAAAEVAESRLTSYSLIDRGAVERALTTAGLPLGKAQMLIALAIERGEDLATLLPTQQPVTPPVPSVAPVETPGKKKKKEIAIPKYQQADRAGNPRQLVPGTRNIWLSGPEMQEVRAEFERVGLTREGKKLAVEKVDVWFEENPAKLAKSSEHKSRILDWGLKAALERSTTEARNKNTKEPKQFLSAEERKIERQNELTRKIRANELLTVGQVCGFEPIEGASSIPFGYLPEGGDS